MDTSLMFSSKTDKWATPQDFFDEINREFGFSLDVCALPENAKTTRYYTPEQDGLTQPWEGVVWCNPPYGRQIGKWVERAALAAKSGAVVVMLLPARTDTKWFHEYIYGKAEIRFVRGRLRFGGAANPAPFPSMVVVFRGEGSRWRIKTQCWKPWRKSRTVCAALRSDGAFGRIALYMHSAKLCGCF